MTLSDETVEEFARSADYVTYYEPTQVMGCYWRPYVPNGGYSRIYEVNLITNELVFAWDWYIENKNKTDYTWASEVRGA
jgi:hypothetical protein